MFYKEEDQFNLNKFVYNSQGIWKELQIENYFADVTLVCEDRQILTHKIVLSFSSPVFRYILKEHSNQNPVIYLTSVKFECLENLVNFMYQGEVTISNGDLSKFLEVAEDLRIRGLYKVNVETVDQIEDFSKIAQKGEFGILSSKTHTLEKYPTVSSNDLDTETNNPLFNFGNANIGALESTKDSERKYDIKKLGRYTLCDICNKDFYHLQRHKDTVHVEKRVRYFCDKCDKSYSNEGDLNLHVASVHRGVRYPCDECDTSPFMHQISLRRHKAAHHRGIRYQCKECEYKASQKAGLRSHVKHIHNGIARKVHKFTTKSTKHKNVKRKNSNMSQEKRKMINERMRQKRANMSPEERKMINETKRQKRANMSPEERKIINEKKRQKRLRDLELGKVRKQYPGTEKATAYSNFLKYCFTRSEVNIEKKLPTTEGEKQLFEMCDGNQIYLFFFNYFWAMEVQSKEDGSTSRPKRNTAEAQKSHIKMSILEKHGINLADSLRFPNYKQDWAQFIANLSS